MKTTQFLQYLTAVFTLLFLFSCSNTKRQNISYAPPEMEQETILNETVNYEYADKSEAIAIGKMKCIAPQHVQETNRENYGEIVENTFKSIVTEPLSTFSLDVDRASYSNMRRMIENGIIPPKDAIRIEEMVNYFNYDYEKPSGSNPVSISTNLVDCPWNKDHKILQVGLKAKDLEKDNLPNSNIVFLVDVSGSMHSHNKLPLVISSFKLLLNQLKAEDRIAIVSYAGNSGVVLESTPVSEKSKILKALNNLSAGGSTAGAAGIQQAYSIAKENFIDGGNNRIVLATDGDFNVGISSAEKLESLIEEKRKTGIFLSVLGFGTGNYQDHQMQVLANKGNGNHAYIDNLKEAQKILIREFSGTMFTLAKDAKIQIEFNPAYVEGYRLIGYENRLLNKEDFNDDTKDAGEIGVGHTVTALYEIIPKGVKSNLIASVDELKYQDGTKVKRPVGVNNNELATVKFRYKNPDESKSTKLVVPVADRSLVLEKTSSDIQFALIVAEFGMVLRSSDYLQKSDINDIIKRLEKLASKIHDAEKSEFIELVKLYDQINKYSE